MDFSEFLSKSFYHNTIYDWAIALGIILASAVIARIVYWLFKNVARRIAAKTVNRIDDVLIDMLEEPVVVSMIIGGIWIGFNHLDFPERFVNWSHLVFNVLIVLNITWLIARTFDAFVTEYFVPLSKKSTNSLDDQIVLVVRKGVLWIIWTLGIIVALNNAGYNVTALITGLGIGGIALAMAAKDTVANIFGGITIFVDKPFRIGHRIDVNGFDGFVEDIGIRSTRIRTLAGRLIIIPNHKFSDQIVENISLEPTRRIVLKLGLTYDTSSERIVLATDLLKSVALECNDVLDETITSFSDFSDFALTITYIYYIKKESDILLTMSEMNLKILKAFNEHELEFAFPTQTIYAKSQTLDK